jgi:signal transduction histidine kinase
MRKEAEGRLKDACRLTGAKWAALVSLDVGNPTILAANGLPASKRRVLVRCLKDERGANWCQHLNTRKPPAALPVREFPGLGVRLIWGYAAGKDEAVIVGTETQRGHTAGIWMLVADTIAGGSTARSATSAGTQFGAAYDSQHGLEGILSRFLDAADGQGGWLGILRGEQLIIAASLNAALTPEAALDLRSSPLLERMHQGGSSLVARRGTADWDTVPHALDPSTRFWAGFPLVVEDRFIGAISVWGQRAPSPVRLRELTALARQVAREVDLNVVVGEVGNQLRRLAALNEFALAISSSEELPHMAQRVLIHLGEMFPAHEIALYVPILDGQLVQEFVRAGSVYGERTAPLLRHPMARLFATSSESGAGTMLNGDLDAASESMQFALPLRYRGTTVGALALRGAGATELSRYDHSMLAIVASYMAGVVEHGRLRAEAEERARRLQETVQQLQEAEMAAGARLTAQQAAESRLVQAAKLVAVGEMAAGVAHELNNPLTTVSGFAELILDETPAEAPYRADLEMVLHEARRARSVVRRLLDFARQGEHVRARADINELVQDVLALMTHFVHTSGVQLELELGQDLPWITLDANQIKQVLLNLLHNALHAMPAGGRLQVRTELQRKDARDWIVARVTDNGIGMDSEEMERIFEPFYTTRAESGGTGLGLSVTYGIVAEHGGTIEVKSQRGRGSTFSVWLPV